MPRWMAVVTVGLCIALAAAQEVPPAPSTAPTDSAPATSRASSTVPTDSAPATSRPEPTEADRLAADSLRHSAMSMIHARWGTQGRAGRLVALAAFAQKLVPNDLQTAWVLSSIYESRYEAAAAEQTALLRLQADPSDYVLGLDYVRLGLAARAKPSDRQTFLQAIIDNPAWPDSLRAHATVEQGRTLLTDRQNAQAAQLFAKALQLDPLNAEAVQGSLSARDTPPAMEDTARAVVVLLQGSPRASGLVRNLAGLLATAGLHDLAAPLFDAFWSEAVAAAPDGKPGLDVAGQYLNALLDSGRYDRAVEVFDPLLEHYARERGVVFMMAEAYRATGRNDQADQWLRRMVADVENAAGGTEMTASDAAELAWTYTVYMRQADQALSYAQRATQADPSSPILQRLLGAAQLISSDPTLVAVGREQLERIRDKDSPAAVLLAENYLAAGNQAAASDAITKAIGDTYSGWTFRRARDLAAKAKITLPTHPSAEALRQIVQQFDPRILDMGRHPEKYLSVKLRSLSDPWQVGQALSVEAVLTNIGDLPVPLGPAGLVRPAMSLQVSPVRQKEQAPGSLPMVIWPAPKYLPPGASVRATVRLDVGDLEYYLARHPLDDVELLVTGMLDPVQQGRQILSSVPAISVPPLTVTRKGLLGDVDPNDPQKVVTAYRYALRVLMTDLVRGDLPRRAQAARQLAELATLVRDVQLFKVRLPDPLKSAVSKPMLLAMVQKALQDPSETVRAEMIAALDSASLDEDLLRILTPAAADPSPLVRFRLVELLCSSTGQGKAQEAIDTLARDTDPLVRQMYSAFGPTGGGP